MRICLSLLLALSLCSTTFGQGRPAIGDRDPVDRDPGGGELTCGADCYEDARAAREAASDCVQNGGDREECLEKYRALLAQCLEDAGCEAPEPPDRDVGDRDLGDRDPRDREPPCGADCYEDARAAREAANECLQNGGDREECMEEYRALVAQCLEDAGCEAPEPPDTDPGDRDVGDRDVGDRDVGDRDIGGRGDGETGCRTECSESAKAAASECLENGRSRERCAEVYREAIGPCLEAAGCESREDLDRDRGDREPSCGLPCFEAARAKVAACRESGGTRDECGAAYRESLSACLEEAGCDDAKDPVVAGLLAAPPFLRGDGNGDGAVDVADAVAILGRLFLGQEAPGCMDAADANDDGEVNLADPVAVLNSLFLGAGPLPEPSTERGHDPTPDDLDCLVSV